MTTPNDIINEALRIIGIQRHCPVGARLPDPVDAMPANDQYACRTRMRDLLDRWHREGLVYEVAPQLDFDGPIVLPPVPGIYTALSYNLAVELESCFCAIQRNMTHMIAARLKADLMPTPQVSSSPSLSAMKAAQQAAYVDMLKTAMGVNPQSAPAYQFTTQQVTGAWDVTLGTGWRQVQINPEHVYNPTPLELGIIALLNEAKREYQAKLEASRAEHGPLPKAPFIGSIGHIKAKKRDWQRANIAQAPYLEYDPDPIYIFDEPEL